jgi:hypothetical protein
MFRTRLIAGVMSGLVLSSVFATVLTLLNFGETFFEPWRLDPSRPAPITLRLPRTTLRTLYENEEIERSAPARTIARGAIVSDRALATHVRAFERSRRPPHLTHLAAYWLVHCLIIVMMTAYLRRGSARQGTLLRTQVGLISLALLFLIGNKGFLLFTDLPPYLLPVGVVPILSAFFLDRRTGMLMSAVITLHAASLVAYDPIVCATYFASCAVGSVVLRERKHAISLFAAGLFGGLAAAIVYVAAKETFDGFSWEQEVAAGPTSAPACALFAGAFAGMGALLLRPLVSRLLGVLSRSQLLNLTDLDQPLLRKMASEAPGSWEHSRAMANLAEAAAASISADALLTRTGAYYHDLGKSIQSKYYIENLGAGERSPHEELEPDVSADAIMAHVIEGTRILREGGIPEPVVEFAYTHHGTSVIEYFWHKCLKQGNPKQLTEDTFRYPGMPPRTKETAILMLIDSIEAGARTIDPPSREAFEALVQRIIFTKLKQGQLDDSGLSLEDLRTLSTRIAETLVSVYHSRIRYPWQDEEDQRAARATPSNGTDPAGPESEPPVAPDDHPQR